MMDDRIIDKYAMVKQFLLFENGKLWAKKIQPFNPSTLQPFNPSTLQPFNPSTLQPFNPSTLQPFNPSAYAKAAADAVNPSTAQGFCSTTTAWFSTLYSNTTEALN